MRFKEPQKCDECGKLYKNLRIYKKRELLCYFCYIKKAHIIWIGEEKKLCPRCKKREKAKKKSYCEICLKKISKEYYKKYYQEHKKEINEKVKAWMKKNPKKRREHQKKYYQKNKNGNKRRNKINKQTKR